MFQQTLPAQFPKGVKVVDKVAEVEAGVRCVISGTIYLDMPLKPNVLEDLTRENQVSAPTVQIASYASEQDVYTMEDMSGRIVLVGEPVKKELICTGLVCALVGSEVPGGAFKVERVIFPGLTDVPQRPIMDDKYIALVSGLHCFSVDSMQLQLMLDYLFGDFNASEAEKIARLVIVGNSFAQDRNAIKEDQNMEIALAKLQKVVQQLNLNNVQVDIMPGANDPASFLLPQRPMHKGMLLPTEKRKGQMLDSIFCRSNPCALDIDGVKLLGTSGQNLDDLMRYRTLQEQQNEESRINIACSMLKWRHIAPSAPDTLCCYPYVANDPFALLGGHIEDGNIGVPNVLFIGNQPQYASRVCDSQDGSGQVRVVLVPKFEESATMVLLNLRTLETKTVIFK